MASIQQRGDRKFKITVCNGYRPGGQKRMQSRTIDVPREIPKRSVLQYVHAEAQKLEKRFRCGMEEDDRTTFEQYAESWLARQTHYKPSTLAGYKRQLEVVYPHIGGIALNKLRPLVLEELCAELRKRKNRRGEPLCEATVRKYLQTVSAVLEDAKWNDILLYNPAHRVRGIRVEKKAQPIPSEFEMRKLLQCILQEPLLYRVFYLTAIATGMRRGELCALRRRRGDRAALPKLGAGPGDPGDRHQKPPRTHRGDPGAGARLHGRVVFRAGAGGADHPPGRLHLLHRRRAGAPGLLYPATSPDLPEQ